MLRRELKTIMQQAGTILVDKITRSYIVRLFASAGACQTSGVLIYINGGWACTLRLAPVRVELLLDHRLRSCLLPRRLMLRLKLHLAALADSDHRNILDAFHDAKIAFSHRYSLPQFPS